MRRQAAGGRGPLPGSPVGALRVLLEAGGGDARGKRPQSAPVPNRRQVSSAGLLPGSGSEATSRRRPSSASTAPVAQYSSPLHLAGPLLRPRISLTTTRRERRLGLVAEADPAATSWSDLEASKIRVVSICDRLEYLKHLQAGLTDLSNKQADELQASCSKSRSRMRDALRHDAPRIESMLETQRQLMRAGGTATKRLSKLHSFVTTQEQRWTGQVGAEAARSSAATFGLGPNFSDYKVPPGATKPPEQALPAEPGAEPEPR